VARDASELISLLEGVRLAIVVDAAPDLGTPGSVYAFSPERLEQAAQNTLSSHGVSVGQALALARVIHADPAPEVHVVAIGIERPRRYVSEVSKRVAGAVPEAAAVILELLDQAAHA
jgi:hydrogenase maturation protease